LVGSVLIELVCSLSSVDRLWDELWEADKRKKDDRADNDARQQRERNAQQV
jgi:hypothetical protein